MNLRQARQDLLAEVMAGNAVLFQSGSGIGKSEMILQVFTHLKAEAAKRGERWGLGIIFAATQTPTDLIGVQWKGEREFPDGLGGFKKVTITDPSLPLWMISVAHGDDPGGAPAWTYDKFFLFIDEYGQGEIDTKRAMAEIFLNGGTAPFYLPAGSPVVAATNAGARYGVTKDFDFCITRRALKNIKGDADIWVEDFADKPYKHKGKTWQVLPYTRAWAKTNPTILFEAEPEEQGPWCNPRSLTAVDRYVQVRRDLNGGNIPMNDPLFMESIIGKMGSPATQSYVSGMEAALSLPSYADVVADPVNCELPGKDGRADLVMLMTYELAHYTKVEHLEAVLTYMSRLAAKAKDMEVTFVSTLLRRDYDHIIKHPAMQKWVTKNAALVSLIAALTH